MPETYPTPRLCDPGHHPRRLLPTILPAVLLLLLCLPNDRLAAQGADRDDLKFLVVMKGGDSFRGNVVGHTDSTITVQTEFNRVTLPKSAIEEFVPLSGRYLRRPHHFLMPTASPNGPGGFISNYELGFLYGGFGIGTGATITAGATIVPGISLASQLYHAGAKVTVEQTEDVELAVGATYTFITTREPFAHLYAVSTTPIGTGRWSFMLFYKISGDDRAPVRIDGPGNDTTRFTLFYEGALGVALGLDTPAFGRDDMGFFVEIWNNDLTNPQNTASVLGVRVFNEELSADFGLSLISGPYVLPAMSFTWNL